MGALNDGARVIIASSRTTVATAPDPFTCTCHLFQRQVQDPKVAPTTTLHWSSSESTLQGGPAEVVRQQRMLHHHPPYYHHRMVRPGVPGPMAMEELYRRQQQQWLMHQQHLDRLSSISDTQLDCTCCSEWLGKALLCSCQLPSSSDEAASPSHHHQNGNGGAMNGRGGVANGGGPKH